MSTIEMNSFDNNDDFPRQRSISEERPSVSNSIKRRSSNGPISPIMIDDENDPVQELKRITKSKQPIKMQQLKDSKNLSRSMIITNNKSSSLKWNTSSRTPRTMAVIPSIGRHAVQGVLVRFFRNADEHHPGAKFAINELEIKSWEAFLNYLNRQPKLALSTGGIKHVYTLNGQEIRSIKKFQNRQSYVVASGMFTKTYYLHINDVFYDDSDTNINPQNQSSTVNVRASNMRQWRSPPVNGEQIFFLPYSRLTMYESMILNRNLTASFDQWLNEDVTNLLSNYIGADIITHLYAVTTFAFTEVKSFSQLFNTFKVADTFIGCTDEEYQHSKRYLVTMKPDDFFANSLWSRKPPVNQQRSIPKQDAKLSISWIHGYDGNKEETKTLYTLSDNEILYVIGSVCILYKPDVKQQRFYTKHNNPITCVNTHRCHSMVASSEITPSKDRSRVSIYIWDYIKLETISELRKEQFGSDITLLSFSPKPDDNLILIVSRDKPKTLLFVDWKLNELIYSITTKSEKILSALFVFNTTEWIACISEQHLLFYHINWNSKPLRIIIQKESEVQNIYTGAVACDSSGERLIVGDKVGSVYVWCLVDNEPKLVVVKESIFENDVYLIVPINQGLFLLANAHNQMKLWSIELNTIEQIRLNDTYGMIQSVCSIQGKLAIGTKLNYIVLKEIDTDEINVIMRGHTNPSICICYNKDTDNFFSISSDRQLFKWNNQTKSVEWSIKAPQLISCAALHPERNIIVLGTETSKLLIYDTLSSFYIATIVLKVNTGVKSVRFSPDGGDLAIGLQNGTVCVFDVLGNGDFQIRTDGASQNNNTSVTDVIWSVDSSYLLAVYSDNDYNIWSIPTFDIVKGKNIQNIPWHQVIHPIACNINDKSIIDAHTSAIILSPNLILCCGKDGQIRLVRNYYERNFQPLLFGLGSIQSFIPTTSNNTLLLSLNNNPAIVEVEVNIES